MKWKACHVDDFSSLATFEVVNMTTSGAASDENVKVTNFLLHELSVWKHMSFRNAAWMSPLKVYEQDQ